MVYRFIRAELEPKGGYSLIDSTTRIGITHRASNTRLRVLSSNGKTAMGIVNCPLLVADEPGSWEVVGGQLMNDAITTALGKPNSPMRAVFIGTLAPSMGGWWHDLIEGGSVDRNYVQALQGDVETWDTWATIRKANPLTAISGDFRRRLLVERDAARVDSRLKARFLSFRLNRPSGDESEVLLTVTDWGTPEIVLQDPVDDTGEGLQLGPLGRRLPQVPGGTENASILRTVSRCSPNTREASRMLIPSTITALRTRRYTSTLYIHHTIHGFGYNPMNDGGRHSIQSPFVSNLPPTRPTLSPPFTTLVNDRFRRADGGQEGRFRTMEPGLHRPP